MRVIVSGVTSLPPYSAGIAWDWVQYALGLLALGHDVRYVEQVDTASCVDEQGQPCDVSASANRRLFEETMSRFGLMDRACLVVDDGAATVGVGFEDLVEFAGTADLLINHSGHLKVPAVVEAVARRVYVDQDPVYTQLWRSEYDVDLDFDKHDVFFTMGLNIGTPASPIPDGGIRWHHILPPVALGSWAPEFDPSAEHFTTVASWSGYSDVEFQGEWYRSKYEEFQKFAALPRHVEQSLEVTLKTFRDDDPGIALLRDNGWLFGDVSRLSTLDGYQGYIRRSRGEIGIAQNAYVKGRSGWFSDRSAHYLASGKPVVAQRTGFEQHLPTGEGLLSFATLDDAAAAIHAINANYQMHCKAARSLAEEFFDAQKILPEMLEISLS